MYYCWMPHWMMPWQLAHTVGYVMLTELNPDCHLDCCSTSPVYSKQQFISCTVHTYNMWSGLGSMISLWNTCTTGDE